MNFLARLFGVLAGQRAEKSADSELARAIRFHESGRLAEAEAIYHSALRMRPQHPQTLHLLGVALHQRDDHASALNFIDQAIAAKPGIALFHFNRGNILAALGETPSAAASFAEATRLNPAHGAAWFNLGAARARMNDGAAAVAAYRRALDLGIPAARFELASALTALGDRTPGSTQFHADAAALLREHWSESGEPSSARFMLAYCLEKQGALSEAEAHYRALIGSNPDSLEMVKVHGNLANCYNTLGRMNEAIRHYRAALQFVPDLADAGSSIVSCFNYDPDATPDAILAEHRNWATRFTRGLRQRGAIADADPERRLRIGYVSPDFRRHPVATLFAPVIEHHDRERFETFCYYNYPAGDAVTERIRAAAGNWRDVGALNHEQLAELVGEDRIDILIDLAGHTTHGRLPLFARKPAGVQVSWLGYFNTTGLAQMDAFISDPFSSPPGQEAWFTEALVRLPDTRFVFRAHEFYPTVGPLPAALRGHITFGCFNNLAKLNRRVLAAWANILDRTPGSRLALQTQALEDALNRERFLRICREEGIDRERIDVRSWQPFERAAHSYQDIDIALDPFPFCGGMTSFDSLWMGVPVVTFAGILIAGRQTASMLANLGLNDLIAEDEARYTDIAVALASDRSRLTALRSSLRPRFAASALCDYERFTRALENAYRDIWRRLAAGASAPWKSSPL